MPLNLSNRDQNSGHLFYNRRLRAAITRFSVRLKHDDRKQQAALVLSVVFVVLGVAWMALLHVLKPAGLVGESSIIGDRDTGAIYVKIDGRLHPALNLTSARLAAGSAAKPTWVKQSEIRKYPTAPMIGIPGAPAELAVSLTATSTWTVCDTAPHHGSSGPPLVTTIAGDVSGSGNAMALPGGDAVLSTHDGGSYVIWDGRRSQIDAANRALTFNLGLDPAVTAAVPMSNALFDALPATESLVVPTIPELGGSAPWLPGVPIGAVLEVRDSAGTSSGFYVLLAGGVQKVTAFVADLLRTAVSQSGAGPVPIAPDKLVDIPEVHVLDVEFYPKQKLKFVDTKANPVTCLKWQKNAGDRQAVIAVLNGRALPVPPSLAAHVVTLVRNDRHPDSVEADQVLQIPGAPNFVASTSAVPTSDTRETLFWISAQGVRYGIEWNDDTLRALGLDPAAAVQAPWPIVRTLAAGPAISRHDALLARDSIAGGLAAPLAGSGG